MHSGLFGASLSFIRSRNITKTKENIFKILNSIVRQLKMHTAYSEKIFLKFNNITLCGIQNRCIWAYSELFIFIRNITKKRKKTFLKFNNIALCSIQNRCIWAYSEASIFTSSRHMAKKQKKIFLKFNNIAFCGIQNRCIWAYSEHFIFIRSRDMAKNEKNIFEIYKLYFHRPAAEIWPPKTEKIYFKLYNKTFEILQRSTKRKLKRCIRIYFKPSISPAAEIWPPKKIFLKFNNIALYLGLFGAFHFTSETEICLKTKKIFLKLYNLLFLTSSHMAKKQKKKIFLNSNNIALIRAYLKPFIFIRSRDMAKNEKNIFEILQQNKKKFLKFNNIALCGIQNRCIRAYSEPLSFIRSRNITKKTKENIFKILQPIYFHQKPRYTKNEKIFLNLYNLPLSFISSETERPKTKIFFKLYNVALCGTKWMHSGLFGAFNFHQKPRYNQKTKENIFEILQRSIVRYSKYTWNLSGAFYFHSSRDMPRYNQKTKEIIFEILQRSIHCAAFKIDAFGAFYFHQKPRYNQKTKENIFEILQRSIVRQLKKMHHCAAIKKDAYEPIPSLLFSPAAEICWAYSELFIFIRSRDMAKKRKKIFLKFYNVAFLFRAFYFHQQPRYGQKTKKKFLKFNNIALCGIQNRCIRAYLEPFIFIRSRDMAKKRKKIFLKFYNIALCGIQNKCIWAYSELFIFIRSRDMAKKRKKTFLKFYNVALYSQKTKKNIFEILQRSIVRQLKRCIGLFRAFYFHQQPRYSQKTKKFLKFNNIALYNQKTKENIFEILQRSIVRQLKKMHTSLFRHCAAIKKNAYGPIPKLLFSPAKPRYNQKRKNIFEIIQRSIVRQLKRCIPEIWPKNEKNIFEILQRSIVRQLKKMHTGLFRAFYFHQHIVRHSKWMHSSLFKHCAAIKKDAYGPISSLLFSPAAEIWPKNKKIFLKFNNIALCGIQNRCIWAYSESFIFIRSRDMAKKRKKIFLKFYNHCAAIKRCIRAYSSLYFHQKPRYGQKTKRNIFEILQHITKKRKKTFLKFNNIALCGIQNRCIWAYSEPFIFTRNRDITKNEKNIFEILQRIIPKNKKIFLKFNNIALCGIQNRCIWAYSEPFIFIRSRDITKKRKKSFLKLYNVAFFYFHQQPTYGQKTKIFLKFNNIALCGIQNKMHLGLFELFIFIRSRDMAKNEKIFLKLYNPFIFIRSRDITKNERKYF
ncbi:hypothetical protein PUN28_019736 [Cardiocondyla obscurior]|uniref:Uncharacterized protein n=1 Tax=Cardiocondyla obscurior TaxID=286306 RepID=A0AAW2E8C7_9HYME